MYIFLIRRKKNQESKKILAKISGKGNDNDDIEMNNLA